MNAAFAFRTATVATACAIAVLPSAIAAREVTVIVVGVDGRPVEHAVVNLIDTTIDNAAGNAAGKPPPPVSPKPDALIDQQGKRFTPWVASVTTNANLAFSNRDNITHHVYSFSPAKRFSFRLRPGEEEAPVVFDQPGVVVLGCNIHDWMVGYVHVSDAAYTNVTDASGRAGFTGLPAAAWKLDLWHPGIDDDTLPALPEVPAGTEDHEIVIRLPAPLSETGPREPMDGGSYSLP